MPDCIYCGKPTFDSSVYHDACRRKADVERVRAERELAAKTLPVVITGVSIPFWQLVWWLTGITAGVTFLHALFDWLVQMIVATLSGAASQP